METAFPDCIKFAVVILVLAIRDIITVQVHALGDRNISGISLVRAPSIVKGTIKTIGGSPAVFIQVQLIENKVAQQGTNSSIDIVADAKVGLKNRFDTISRKIMDKGRWILNDCLGGS